MRIIIAIFLSLCFCTRSFAANIVISSATDGNEIRVYKAGDKTLSYLKPAFWRTQGRIPADIGSFVANSFSKESLPWTAAVAASSLILIRYDQELFEDAQHLGKKLSISSIDKTKPYLTINGVAVLRGPSDLGSALYFIGDGWVSLGLCAYFETYGFINDDWRAITTGHQLVEGLLATGLTTQILKRITGRETPSASTGTGGVWRTFPSFNDFQSHRTRYDAFPSGHLATGMMVVTVMSDNYPEKYLIKPIGYALLAGLSFQMMNNSVHWAGDYPLGLGIGYMIGRAITANAFARAGNKKLASLQFMPTLASGGPGLNLSYKF